MEITTSKKPHDPGAEPYNAFHAGTTQKPGVTIRAEFASRFVSALLNKTVKFDLKDDELFIKIGLHMADELISQLYPAPVSKTQMNTGHIQEQSACAHDGEIIIQNGRGQCMKCKNAVPTEELMRRMKK